MYILEQEEEALVLEDDSMVSDGAAYGRSLMSSEEGREESDMAGEGEGGYLSKGI